MKKIIIILAVLTLNACSFVTKPVPFGLYRGMDGQAPDGTPEFRSGWKDGCESGMAAYGPLHYKAAYGYKYDHEQLQSNEYHSAWRIGFRHCRWYTAEWNR